jgi:hypothetical protein
MDPCLEDVMASWAQLEKESGHTLDRLFDHEGRRLCCSACCGKIFQMFHFLYDQLITWPHCAQWLTQQQAMSLAARA